MRKSNVIIIAILMVASIAFLWLWNYLGFHLIDMRDLVITILWWIITIGLCIAIHIAEKRRREPEAPAFQLHRALSQVLR